MHCVSLLMLSNTFFFFFYKVRACRDSVKLSALTSDIFPHMDLLCDIVNLRVSARPQGWQKPFRKEKKSVKHSASVVIKLQHDLSTP